MTCSVGPTLELVPEEAVLELSAILIEVEIADQVADRIAVSSAALDG